MGACVKFFWHGVRAISILCIVLAAGWNLKAAIDGDPQAHQLMMSLAQAAGFLVPMWLLWRAAVFSHRKIASDVR